MAGHTHGVGAYVLVFGILVACGMGVPLPEDVSLVTGGFLAHLDAAHLPIMMVVGFFGIVAGDSIIFVAGRRLGAKVGTKQTGFFARIVTPEKRARVEALFHAHGQKIIMAARFLPGVRAVTFFTAGSAGMAYWRFIVWDGMAPLLVYLGYYFGDNIDAVLIRIRHGQVRVIAAILLAAVLYIAYSWWRAKRIKAQAKDAASKPSDSGNGAPEKVGAIGTLPPPSPAAPVAEGRMVEGGGVDVDPA
jgi:membrane protein DedA with SNARE-associated domain